MLASITSNVALATAASTITPTYVTRTTPGVTSVAEPIKAAINAPVPTTSTPARASANSHRANAATGSSRTHPTSGAIARHRLATATTVACPGIVDATLRYAPTAPTVSLTTT